MEQTQIDAKNIEFWNELCGTGLAHSLRIHDASPQNLRRFDDAYFAIYPYLLDYLDPARLARQKVLEIGLGYGTLGQRLVDYGANYYGLDIAPGPVAMMRYRLEQRNNDNQSAERVQTGTALEIPHPDALFDYVYTIGCLHHTGNLGRAISEVHRVLKPGGTAVVTLYNRYSFRQLVQIPLKYWRSVFAKQPAGNFLERVRALYDTNAAGQAAPHTDYVSPLAARQLFREFSQVKIDIRNFDSYQMPIVRVYLPREKFLNNLGRVLGLDLYITAQR